MENTEASAASFDITEKSDFESKRSAFYNGAKDLSPILIGVLPFAAISGITMVSVGFSPILSIAMSFIVFAGAGMLAAADLAAREAPAVIVILTCLIVNLRFIMYSAALAPHFRKVPSILKIPMAYMLSDQAFAVFTSKYHPASKDPYRHFYFFGGAFMMWAGWQIGYHFGVLLGIAVPKSWSLEFAIPLTFLALLVPKIKVKSEAAAALTAAAVALIAHDLPMNSGLVIGAAAGIIVGVVTDRRKERKQQK